MRWKELVYSHPRHGHPRPTELPANELREHWSIGFMSDQLADGRPSRESIAIDIAHIGNVSAQG